LKLHPIGQQKELESNVSGHQTLGELLSTFDDKYAGKGPLTRSLVAAEQKAGGLADLVPGMDQNRANWWAKFRQLQELPARHALFGATLTAGEQKAWEGAQRINPGSSPATVRAAMKELQDAVKARNERLSKQLKTEGKDPSAYHIEEPKGKAAPTSDDDLVNKYLK